MVAREAQPHRAVIPICACTPTYLPPSRGVILAACRRSSGARSWGARRGGAARGGAAGRSPGAARRCSSPARPGSARRGSRPSSRPARAPPASRCSSAAASTSSARSCRTSRSSTRCGRTVGALPWRPGRRRTCSRRRSRCSTGSRTAAPVLLVLEDVHWADASTLDLVVFLAHNVDERRVLLLATYRPDEPASAERMRRLADGVRRSGSALLLELGPLEHDELAELLAARAAAPPPTALTDAILARSEGNPFFAEELLAAAGDRAAELPRVLRDLLLQRVARARPPDAGRAAPRGGRRARRRLPAAAARRPSCLSATCASRCGAPSSTASSSPTRRRARSASGTRCSRRRSTRRSSRASARSCTRGSPTSSHAPTARGARRARAALGGGRPCAGGARGVGRGGARGGGRLRGRRGASRTSSARSGCGPSVPDAERLRAVDLAGGLLVGGRAARSRRATRRAPPSWVGRRSIWPGTATGGAPRFCTSGLGRYLLIERPSRRGPRRVRARGRARSRANRRRRSAPRCSRRSATRSCSCGATRSRAPFCDRGARAGARGRRARAEFRALACSAIDHAYLGPRRGRARAACGSALRLAEENGRAGRSRSRVRRSHRRC